MSDLSAAEDEKRHDGWLDRFFESYYRRRPVNATFVGVHTHDRGLPDFSEEGAGDTLADMQSLLREASRFEASQAEEWRRAPSPAEPPRAEPEAIDRRLAEGFLKIQIREYESDLFHRGNPSLYTGEAIFGVMSLFLSDFAQLSERIETAIERLRAIPALLRQGRANLDAAPFAWTERAIRECDGALAFLSDGIPLVPERNAGDDDHPENPRGRTSELLSAADVAATAFAEFREFLDTELSTTPREFDGCGPEMLALYLREGHCIDMPAEEIVAYAEEEMAEAASRLAAGATEQGAASSADALAMLEDLHPAPEKYYARYQEIWDTAKETALHHELVTWPDFPIRYVPRYEWAQTSAPCLYFLFYRSPAAFNRPRVHDYLVTPIDASMPAERQRELLRANNDSVIKLNHVIHHGGIGHHVQNWNAFHSGSRVGRMAAVDCASRIAMFCGGTMAEGWACYATDLMEEFGALTPLERCAQHNGRIRMCARAIVDVGLHEGRLTIGQATDFYEREAGMSPAAARAEAVKNSMFPGAALMYLTGTDGIHRLRAEMASLQGERFRLRDFHDALLSYGSIPVSVVGGAMKRAARAGPPGTTEP